MTDFEDKNQSNQLFSHNVEVALIALKRICSDSNRKVTDSDSTAWLEHVIDYDFQIKMIAANTNRKLTGVLEQITIYMMMERSPTFKDVYLSHFKKSQHHNSE